MGVILRHAGDDIAGHQIAHKQVKNLFVFGRFADHIPFGQDTYRLARRIGHNQCANVMLCQYSHRVANLFIRGDGDHSHAFGCQNSSHFHVLLSI